MTKPKLLAQAWNWGWTWFTLVVLKWGNHTVPSVPIPAPHRGHLEMPVDICYHYSWRRGVPLASGGQKPEVLLNISQCSGQSPKQRTVCFNMSVLSYLGNCGPSEPYGTVENRKNQGPNSKRKGSVKATNIHSQPWKQILPQTIHAFSLKLSPFSLPSNFLRKWLNLADLIIPSIHLTNNYGTHSCVLGDVLGCGSSDEWTCFLQ